jgi:hypothetical protein
MRHGIQQLDLAWRGLKLYHGRRRVAEVVPDEKYPNMWRVKIEGELSDMVNLSRAKDAALCLTVSRLNAGRSEPVGRPLAAIPGEAA